MAENIVDALIVTMGLDNSDYERGMNEVEDRTRQFSERAPRDVERGLNSIEQRFGATFQGIFRTFIAPLTAALGTMGIFSQYTQTADRIGKTAARIGASAEELQAFGEAAKRSGGSVEGFISSFESLNGQIQRMQAMGGKGRLTPILKQLGISATENGKAKDTFQILRELAGASERIGKQKFAGLARFLGLDQGTIMLLQSGRVAMDELIARQRALGVYTKEDFEITAKFNDAISDLQQSFRAMAAPILQVITPALTTLAKWLTNIVQTFREHQGFIVAGLTVIAATMSGVLLKAATALGAALMPLLGPIAAVAALGAIFDEIATYAEGGETAFQGLWEAIGTPEDFKAVGTAIKEAFSSGWEELEAAAKTVAEWLLKIGENLAPLKDAIAPVVDAFKSLLSTGGELVAWAAEFAAQIASLILPLDEIFSPGEPGSGWSALRKVAEVISLAFQSLSYVVKEVSDWLGNMTKKAREALKALDFVTPLKNAFKELAGYISGLFSPGQPGSEWNVLQSIIDGIKSGIDMMIGAVKSLFAWITRVINGISVWLTGGEQAQKEQAQKKSEIIGNKTEEEYVSERADEITKARPEISREDAQNVARKELKEDAELKVLYDRFGGDQLSLSDFGYTAAQITAFEERQKARNKPVNKMAADMPKPAADASIKAKDQPSPSWWNALFSSKAAPEAAAAITSRAPDAAKIQQDNSRKTTVNVKNDTVVNNRFEGVTDGNAAGLMNDAANSTQRAVERGNSFAVNNGTASIDPGVFK